MTQVPYIVPKSLHTNLTYLISTNDDKYDINDTNRIPYIARFNKVLPNLFCVGDENGFLKLYKSFPKLTTVKEISAEKSCIYDIQWLSSYELACGGGDKFVSVFDLNTCTRTALLKGHTESVKSISQIDRNPFLISSGSRDGAILIFDLRCNKHDLSETTDLTDDTRTISLMRPIAKIYNAHYIDKINSCPVSFSAFNQNNHFMRPKSSITNNAYTALSPKNNSSKSYPVSCVLFQNDFYLVSSGATDGYVKLWDIRKIRSNNDSKPISLFDNLLNIEINKVSNSKNIKGYSNLLFNNNRTLLYANCMNNYIYEYNFLTYNNNHTRVLNKCKPKESSNQKYTYNSNQSNFIKSSLSNCNNFILTGSSDYNAYIYYIHNDLQIYKNKIPVIILKGHSNEVTTVDWNPFNSNQLITCSDDNTVRVWNVEREFNIITSKESECSFYKAEVLCEDDKITEEISNIKMKSKQNISNILGYSNMYDDYFFKNYTVKNKQENFDIKVDLEDDLCDRYEKIKINNENRYKSEKNNLDLNKRIFFFKDFEKPLSNLPINLIDVKNEELNLKSPNIKIEISKDTVDEGSIDKLNKGFAFRRQNSSNTLLSVSNKIDDQIQVKKKLKAKILNSRKNCSIETPKCKEKSINFDSNAKKNNVLSNPMSCSASKKRNALACLNENESLTNTEPKTPRSKRRLLMSCNELESNQNKPNLEEINLLSSHKKTILDYFVQNNVDK